MMSRGKILLTSLGFLPLFSFCQNLVPNPGFENHISCVDPPANESMINCSDWFNAVEPLSTIDWFSTCYPAGSFYLLPDLYFGFSYLQSGEAMIGFTPYSNFTNTGESLGIRMSAPLKADSAYCFGFWVKNSRNHNNDYSLFNFDIAFVSDTTSIDHRSDLSSYVTIQNSPDDGEWNLLSSYYIAQGGEEYMLIGAFATSPGYYMEDPVTTPENKLYYYFDDFFVVACDKDSILSVILDLPNVFTPNGDTKNPLYTIGVKNIKSMDVTILNRWGNVVKTYDGLSYSWDGTNQNGESVNEGVYFINVIAESNFGDVLTKSQFLQIYR